MLSLFVQAHMQICLTDRKGTKLITPSAKAQAALLMRWATGKHTTAEIARALNTS